MRKEWKEQADRINVLWESLTDEDVDRDTQIVLSRRLAGRLLAYAEMLEVGK